jgi:alpha-galactosidase
MHTFFGIVVSMLRAKVFFGFATSVVLLAVLHVNAQQKTLASTPPMGWNSWDSYGLTITEEQFRANVAVEAARLKPAGFTYAVVDEGWYLANPESADKHPEALQYRTDEYGRYQPALNRFPSATSTSGFAAVAQSVHAQGLKFGIHIIRGVPKSAVKANLPVANSGFHAADLADTSDVCFWNPDNYGVKDNAAGQAWYDAMFAQYAKWGIDYVKVDCISSHPYKADEIRMIHNAIVKTGRPIVLSLSPGPTSLANAEEVGQNAQLWRISNDVWDNWTASKDKDEFPQSVKSQFAVIESWTKYVKPGNWPDADMLPLGTLGPVPGWGDPRQSKLTHDEQRTLITLWCISRSPLFFGGNLTQLDDWTISLLTNPAVIAMNQHGTAQHLASTNGDTIAWTSKGLAGQIYLALFNLGDAPASVKSPFTTYGLPAKSYKSRDLWANSAHPASTEVVATIPPHGTLLLELE